MAVVSIYSLLELLVGLASPILAQPWPNPHRHWQSPEYTWIYEFPLPIPPVKQEKWPSQPFYNPVTGHRIKYYEVDIQPFTRQIYPNLGPTTFIGYDGILPAPVFVEERGVESVVRFTNHGQMASSVHLHGSYSRSPFDGWANDLTGTGQYKDYFYPNLQSARMIWYHDHALAHTAQNAYFGQLGAYIIHDPAEDSLGLPGGYGKYDIPLLISSKQYNSDGSLFNPANVVDSLYGDVFEVNGQPWPYFKVEPRRYRFRLLNAAVSRAFQLYFSSDEDPATSLDFSIVASDAGLLTQPHKTNLLFLSMGERYELVVDFAPWKGQNISLLNRVDFVPQQQDFRNTDKIMRFVVGGDAVDDPSQVLRTLRAVPFPESKNETVARRFVFSHDDGQWRINGVTFMDAQNRILARPDRGQVEVWGLENHAAGTSHPVHLHLVDFRVLSRSGGQGGPGEPASVQPYESTGLKDVVWLGPGESVTLEAHFAPWPGVYMFHCHNLIHEDHMMMAAFNVSAIAGLGYNETNYIDPMDLEWRPREEKADDYTYDRVKKRLEVLSSYQPYNNASQIGAWLSSYWATRTVSPGGSPSEAKQAQKWQASSPGGRERWQREAVVQGPARTSVPYKEFEYRRRADGNHEVFREQ